MSQLDDLNAAQKLVDDNIAIVNSDLDALGASSTALGQRIAALPGGVDLTANIAQANASATAVLALGDRVNFVKNQLDGFIPAPPPAGP